MPTDPDFSPEAIAEALREATPGPWVGVIKPNGKGTGLVGVKAKRGTGEQGCIAVINSIPGGKKRVANTKLLGNAPTWLAQLLAALEAAEAKRKEWADLYCLAVEEGQKALDGLHKAERDAVTTQTHLSVAEAALEAKDGEVERLRVAWQRSLAMLRAAYPHPDHVPLVLLRAHRREKIMPGRGITTVKLRVNRMVWARIEAEARRMGASEGLVIAAAMDAYDAVAPSTPKEGE